MGQDSMTARNDKRHTCKKKKKNRNKVLKEDQVETTRGEKRKFTIRGESFNVPFPFPKPPPEQRRRWFNKLG